MTMESPTQVAQGAEAFAALLDAEFDYERPRRREIREATIIQVDESQVLVDLGAKRDGIVPSRDLELLSPEYRSTLNVGDAVPVSVLDASDQRDGILVSINKGLAQQDWLKAEAMRDSEETFDAVVQGVNRGGVVVAFGRVRGFVPNSHLTSIPRGLRGEQASQAKHKLVGTALTLAVLDVDRRQRRLVLSERVARSRRHAKLLQELQEGEIRVGVVRNLASFGAFVDIGGIDGLVHVSELAWSHVVHPRDVVAVGDQLEVYVLSVDRDRERIGLSRKRLLPDPWAQIAEEIAVGEVLEGTVTSLASFGAFVEVRQDVEGLIHVSEMPDGAQTLASLQVGQPITVRVIRMDIWRRRISLSLLHVTQSTAWPAAVIEQSILDQREDEVAEETA